MSMAIENLLAAQQIAYKIKPKVNGFPFMAEILRLAGIQKQICSLPSCQNLYHTNDGPVVIMGNAVILGQSEVPEFNLDNLIFSLKTKRAGESSQQEFFASLWRSGVVQFEIDYEQRTISYFGCLGESYTEEYPKIEVKIK